MQYVIFGYNIPVYTAIGGAVMIVILVITLRAFFKYDPVYNCTKYKEVGCSHLDGYECDYPMCEILYEHEIKREETNGIEYGTRNRV